ncbi:MAG: class I SAM-dependent methyltransferase [Alphaproteobacteria bacterium]|nr:class I SAM-dependent methyltransferase [Alphaproteobacteria bacterium]
MKIAKAVDLSYLESAKKEVDCPICSSKEFEIFSQGMSRGGIDLAYAICKTCSHIYLKYRPTADSYDRFYSSGDYRKLTGDDENTKALYDNQDAFKKRYSHGERLYNEYLKGRLGKEDIVFDFGCGDGAWLYGLNQMTGCKIDGNEPSLEDVQFIKDKMGVDIFHGLIEDQKDQIIGKYKGKVKLAIISGSLQHMLDPRLCLEIAHEILEDDGYLYVCNKNIFEHYLSVKSPFPRPFSDLRTVDHPHYFHEESYRYMLEGSGFNILNFSNDSKIRAVHMEVFAQKRRKVAGVAPKGDYAQVVAGIRSMEKKVVFYRSFVARLIRGVKRLVKTL